MKFESSCQYSQFGSAPIDSSVSFSQKYIVDGSVSVLVEIDVPL